MFKKIGVTALSIICILTQVGCVTTGSGSTASEQHVISSETEQQIMKEATVAGTVGGLAVSALLISAFGENWPLPVKLAVGIGGTLAIQKVAQYMAMDQIATLNDVTLENDKKEALLFEARKVNTEYAQLNADLKASIEENKDNKEVLEVDLEKAMANKKNMQLILKDRKLMLDMLVKNSEQYNEFAVEIAQLKKEDEALASVITELNDLGIAGV